MGTRSVLARDLGVGDVVIYDGQRWAVSSLFVEGATLPLIDQRIDIDLVNERSTFDLHAHGDLRLEAVSE